MLKLCWIACVLSIVLSGQFAVARSTEVTVSDLSRHAQKFDGQFVHIQAVLVFGWEGDNFLLDPSRPRPVSMPSRDPASVWFYCKPGHEQGVYGRIGHERVVYGSFGGYFHFVSKTHIVNGVFEPGPLQFEAVEVSIPDQQPRSLAAATTLGDVDATRRILQANASVRAQYGSTLLFLAARVGRADFAQELLASGADPKFVAPGGDTSLMMAAWGCKLEVAEALLDHGALVNAANNSGETALIFASQTCPDGKLVHLLLADGADPNTKGNDGGTALRAAAGNPMVVEKLLAAGADPTVKDKYGNTVESESCDRGEKGHYQVCQLVRDALRNAATN